MKELVFGHKNPDTDAIVAAKAYAFLQNALGNEVEAVALGTPNEETKFVLEHFEEPAPRVIEKAAPEVEAVMLVDHNEEQQSERLGAHRRDLSTFWPGARNYHCAGLVPRYGSSGGYEGQRA